MLTGRDLWWSVIHLHVWSRNSACKANRGSTYEAQELPTWVFILCMLICSIQRNRSLLLGKPQPRNGVQCLSLVNAFLSVTTVLKAWQYPDMKQYAYRHVVEKLIPVENVFDCLFLGDLGGLLQH